MTDADIRSIIRAVLEEEHERNTNQADDIVLQTVATILKSFGIDEKDQAEIQADFRHLRKWRKSVERVETVGWGAAITVIVSGILGMLWLGLKTAVGK